MHDCTIDDFTSDFEKEIIKFAQESGGAKYICYDQYNYNSYLVGTLETIPTGINSVISYQVNQCINTT